MGADSSLLRPRRPHPYDYRQEPTIRAWLRMSPEAWQMPSCTARRRRMVCARACAPAPIRQGERQERQRVSQRHRTLKERSGKECDLENPAHQQRPVRSALAPAIVTDRPRRHRWLGGAKPTDLRNRARCGLARRRQCNLVKSRSVTRNLAKWTFRNEKLTQNQFSQKLPRKTTFHMQE